MRKTDRPAAHRGRGDSGAILVEAAFMLPIVILIVFGVIEYGMLFKDSLTVSAAVRAGARVGITQARNPAYLQSTEDAVQVNLQNVISNGQIKYLTIYKANSATGGPVGGSFENCTTDCSRFTFSSGGAWVAAGGSGWAATTMKACGDTANTDFLGVYVRVQHSYFTGLFGSSKQLQDHVVFRLEPIPKAQTCS